MHLQEGGTYALLSKHRWSMASTPALPKEDDEPIFSLAEDCETLFQQETSRLQSEESKQLRTFEEHQQRFTAWTAYMGVFAKRSLCLDRKLRHHPDLQDLVLRLLDILKTNLSYILDTQNKPEPEPSEEFSTEDEAEPSPQVVDKDALDAVDGAIDRLNRLGVAIRQSSTRRLTARDSSRVSGFHSFKELATLFVKTAYPGATYELQDQLGRSMAERFDNIIARQSQHAALGERRPKTTNTLQSIAEDMALDEEPAADVPVQEEDPAMNETQYHRMISERTGQYSSFPKRHNAWGRHSEASMSSIDRQVLRQKMSGSSNVGSQQKKKETSSIQINQVGYPKAPQVKNNPNHVICRKHVDNDLKPYLCISEKCVEPTCSFTTFKNWKEHMIVQHGVMWHQDVHPQAIWVCAVCHEPPEGFQSPHALYNHMENDHHFTEAQLEAIVAQSKVQGRRRPDICPMCFLHVEEDPSKASKSPTAREFVSADAGKRQQEPPVPESMPKRVRTSSDVGQTSPRELEDTAKVRSSDELNDEAGVQNSLRIDLMARHVAAHLQGLMFLTIRLMSLRDNGAESVSIASSSADSGDASTRKITSPGNSEPEPGSPMSISDQESIEDGDDNKDGADDIPDSKSDPDWSRVIQSNKQQAGPDDLGELLHLSHPDDMDLTFIEYRFPYVTKTVQIHLARSTTIRRRRLLYLQHRQARLTVGERQNSPPSIPDSVPMTAMLDMNDENFNLSSARMPKGQIVPDVTDSYSLTNPPSPPAPYIYEKSVSNIGMHSENFNMVYPPPPRVSRGPERGSDYASCLYCGDTFQSSLFLNSSWWRLHVTHDVQPYVCLFSRCSSLFFSKYREWAAHMNSVHSPSWFRQLRGFVCPLRDECRIDGKTIPPFEDPGALARHIEINHKVYGEAVFKSPADAVESSSQSEDICPLCEDFPSLCEDFFVLQAIQDPDQRMARHIAEHLKSAAFRLLPYDDSGIEDLDSTSTSIVRLEVDVQTSSLCSDALDDVSLNFGFDAENAGRSKELLNITDEDEVTPGYSSLQAPSQKLPADGSAAGPATTEPEIPFVEGPSDELGEVNHPHMQSVQLDTSYDWLEINS
ncbi:hypothetical protein EG329_007584 [Mollisiaceae sp. DMI_Dod_QoI]|nr:hypothetical protein EG329_007584 [Helotiales sp. DMI_Dod_QoI]